MKRLFLFICGALFFGFAVFWVVTIPKQFDPSELVGLDADPVLGEAIFNAAGCASCHMAQDSDDRRLLGGGQGFPSDFGTFYAPNISPHMEFGLGGWTVADLANAMHYGTSPERKHYFPAFPYTTYAKLNLGDIAALHSYLMTLPKLEISSKPHDVGFPFNIRRSLGGWKFLFGNDGWVLPELSGPELERGRYLVEALGHCGECHTPRNVLGGLREDRWLAGAPDPSGKGRVPNITPAALDWNDIDLFTYFTTGFTPEFDVAGGHMTKVIENLKLLPKEDLNAIIAYLRVVPPIEPDAAP